MGWSGLQEKQFWGGGRDGGRKQGLSWEYVVSKMLLVSEAEIPEQFSDSRVQGICVR